MTWTTRSLPRSREGTGQSLLGSCHRLRTQATLEPGVSVVAGESMQVQGQGFQHRSRVRTRGGGGI